MISRHNLLTAVLDPERSLSVIKIEEVALKPKSKIPLHLHSCPVVGVVLRGIILFQIEEHCVRHLLEGDVFYVPANSRIAKFNNEEKFSATVALFYLLEKDEDEMIHTFAFRAACDVERVKTICDAGEGGKQVVFPRIL